ncbi:MAG: molybdenum cofactor guanylyltransferase MobA [Pseudomonadota bacterium]
MSEFRTAKPIDRAGVAAVILAGGLARRMGGGDKTLLNVGGRPLLAHVIERLSPQVDRIMLNANGDPARFGAFGLSVEPDPLEGFLGPLAGVLAGLRWAERIGARHVVSVAGDTPFFPTTLVNGLIAAAERTGTPLACAETDGRDHPTFGLWPVALADDLETALRDEGLRKVVLWTEKHGCARASFDAGPPDPFFNVNTPDDMAEAEAVLTAGA